MYELNMMEIMSLVTKPLTIILFCLAIGLIWWGVVCQNRLNNDPRYWDLSSNRKLLVFFSIFIVFPFLLLFGMLGDE
jgi:hypothetical protein